MWDVFISESDITIGIIEMYMINFRNRNKTLFCPVFDFQPWYFDEFFDIICD